MATAEQYLDELQSIVDSEFTCSTIPEAKRGIKECNLMKKKARQLKRRVNQEMKEIRAEYKQGESGAGGAVATAFQIFGKRKLAGKVRAQNKQSLQRKRDRVLSPYEEVKHRIDDVIVRLDEVKLKFEEWIAEAKAVEEETAEDSYCTQCGEPVGESDNFCSGCGQKVAR